MSEPSEKAKAPYLLPEDALAYERFLDWSLGGGFKLALIERRHPEERKALVAWTLERVPGAKVAHLEEGDWMRGQIEAACGGEKAGEVPLLIVTGLEDAAERERACAQLNVERDELARDFAIPWVLITHPAAVLELQQRAPDFCDFVGLWLGDSGGLERIEVPRLAPEWKPLSLAQIARMNGESDKERALRLQALKLNALTGSKFSRIAQLRRLSEMEIDAGHREQARGYMEEALSLSDQVGRRDLRALMLIELATLDAEHPQALRLLEEALLLAEEFKLNGLAALCLFMLGSREMAQGKFQSAERHLNDALSRLAPGSPVREQTERLLHIVQGRSKPG